jgi:hypothetical protein
VDTKNPTGNRFCGGCGAPLERRCPACKHTNPPDHRFCGSCGAVLGAAPPPLIGGAAAAPVGAKNSALAQREPGVCTPKHLAEKVPAIESGAGGGEHRDLLAIRSLLSLQAW